MSKMKLKKEAVNYTTPLNFEKFHKAKCNRKFNETIAI